MTRYEVIQRFAGDPRSHRDHLVTFLVLAELWVEQGRPDSINLDFAELLRMLDTKRSTLFRWLSQLESFGYIELQRATNQRQKTTVRLTIAHTPTETACTEVRQQIPKWDSTTPNQALEPALPIPQLGQQCPKWDGTDSNETAEPGLLMPEMRQHVPNWDGSDRSETAEMPNAAQNRGFSELSTVATPDLSRVRDHHHLINKLSIISKDDNQVVNDEKGVQGKKRKRIKRESPRIEKSTFANSTIADIASFREAFANDPTGKTADLDHYYGRLLNWRDRRGNVPERTDWISTARTFMLNDNREGKLVTHQTTPSYVSNTRNSRAHIEPPGNRVFSW